ncbi:hypothetical protein [Glutamicibacter halophytocola]|uniref:Uncharacterized protein n=1 Tax=Glutamicibacter halophytocola TaxID=1933880 RepID=A0AA94XVR8_9MICC|nr:hypothetical protein [Glutamicibacter halophytocola]UUX59176.1 hypothetical protein NUH22_00580 [Glutamicibacter halophytocola]
MSARFESDTGLVWNVQRERIRLGSDRAEKLTCVRIRKLPEDGRFSDEMKAVHPDVGVINFILDESDDSEPFVDLTGISQLRDLKVISIYAKNQALLDVEGNVSKLPLVRVIATYVKGVSEALIQSPDLQFLELEGAPMDILGLAPSALNTVTLRKLTQSKTRSAWEKLSALKELNVENSGTVHVSPPSNQWPEIVSFISVASLKDIVKASQCLPFKFLYLEGIRIFDPGASFWDLKAKRVTVGYETKPPKWLVDAWPMRPAAWANWLVVPYHPSLPGSEDAVHEEYDVTDESS